MDLIPCRLTTRRFTVFDLTRTRYVEDLAPGDRISIDGADRVVRTTTRRDDDQFLVELVAAADAATEVLLHRGSKVEVV